MFFFVIIYSFASWDAGFSSKFVNTSKSAIWDVTLFVQKRLMAYFSDWSNLFFTFSANTADYMLIAFFTKSCWSNPQCFKRFIKNNLSNLSQPILFSEFTKISCFTYWIIGYNQGTSINHMIIICRVLKHYLIAQNIPLVDEKRKRIKNARSRRFLFAFTNSKTFEVFELVKANRP